MPADIGLQLAETDVYLVKAYLSANMATALLQVATTRASTYPVVAVDPPADYFVYNHARAYRSPAVFIIPERMDFKKRERRQNHINAETRLNVTVVIEDKDAERIYLKAYRYQAALAGLLDQAELTSADGKVKIITVIENCQFSPLYSDAKNPEDPRAVFRKEVSVELAVQHYESLI